MLKADALNSIYLPSPSPSGNVLPSVTSSFSNAGLRSHGRLAGLLPNVKLAGREKAAGLIYEALAGSPAHAGFIRGTLGLMLARMVPENSPMFWFDVTRR